MVPCRVPPAGQVPSVCGYCGITVRPAKGSANERDPLCPRHEHMRDQYREADDRWQSETDEPYMEMRRR